MITNEEADRRVCVIWRESWEKKGQVSTLTYKPQHTVRTYEPDSIDPRAGDLRVVTDPKDMMDLLHASEDPIAIPVRLAMTVFKWKLGEFE